VLGAITFSSASKEDGAVVNAQRRRGDASIFGVALTSLSKTTIEYSNTNNERVEFVADRLSQERAWLSITITRQDTSEVFSASFAIDGSSVPELPTFLSELPDTWNSLLRGAPWEEMW